MKLKAFAVFAVIALTHCVRLVPYLPQTTVAEPQAEIEKIIMSNAGYGIVRVEFKPGYFTVASLSGYGTWQQSLRYEQVKKIEIYAARGVHRVVATDMQGEETFSWGVKGIADAQALADAIASQISSEAPTSARSSSPAR